MELFQADYAHFYIKLVLVGVDGRTVMESANVLSRDGDNTWSLILQQWKDNKIMNLIDR